MPMRNIIKINEEKCDGCGDCVTACAEGAIAVIDGKAKLISETYCDGLGACLGHCPRGAITVEQREAPDFDEATVETHLAQKTPPVHTQLSGYSACPGSAMRQMGPRAQSNQSPDQPIEDSQLGHWPVQLSLIPPHAPFLQGAKLVICADCVPFAVPDFHQRYLTGKAVVVGCPKLDDLQAHYEKLAQICKVAKPARIIVLRMEVPCCGGIGQAAVMARNEMAPEIPLEIHTVGIRGGITVQQAPTNQQTQNSCMGRVEL